MPLLAQSTLQRPLEALGPGNSFISLLRQCLLAVPAGYFMRHAHRQAKRAHQNGLPLGQAWAGGVSVSLVQHCVLHVDDMRPAPPPLQLALLLQILYYIMFKLLSVSQPFRCEQLPQAVLLQTGPLSLSPAQVSSIS